MDLGLTGKVAAVTGASKGIGLAVAGQLLDEGAKVGICARTPDDVERAASELSGRGRGEVLGVVADMAQAESVTGFLDRVTAELGPVDVLVNNVGDSPSRNFLHMSDDDWFALFELNLMSAVRATRHVLPAMRQRRWGRVVMVATGAAKYPNAPLIDYSATKAAMVAVGKALATKYGADDVLVNSVLPGLIDTPMWDRAADEIGAAAGRSRDEVKAGVARSVPVGRYGTADEVAAAIVFLCSERASYVNGVALSVDGGQGTSTF